MDISRSIKVILVGEVNTGKTSIINKLLGKSFNDKLPPTNEANQTHYQLDKLAFSIWDISGQEKFRALNRVFYKEAKVVIFVYSITDRKSFEELDQYWYKEINNVCQYPSILLFLLFSSLRSCK